MSLWSFIGDFFLFRWLFGSHKHHDAANNGQDLLSDSRVYPTDDYDDESEDIYDSYDDVDELDELDDFDM